MGEQSTNNPGRTYNREKVYEIVRHIYDNRFTLNNSNAAPQNSTEVAVVMANAIVDLIGGLQLYYELLITSIGLAVQLGDDNESVNGINMLVDHLEKGKAILDAYKAQLTTA